MTDTEVTGDAVAEPVAELDERYGEVKGQAVPWPRIRERLAAAPLYWLSTVRPDGRPHITPLIGVWSDGALVFCTGPDERKAKNLRQNRNCGLTTGTNDLHSGLDVVLNGEAVQVRDDHMLQHLAAAYEEKYGPEWHFEVDDGGFRQPSADGSDPGPFALVFAVAPVTVFGFGKDPYSQSRYRFDGR